MRFPSNNSYEPHVVRFLDVTAWSEQKKKGRTGIHPQILPLAGEAIFPGSLSCNYRPTPSQRRIRGGGRHFRLTSVLSTLPTPTSCLVGLAARLVCTLHVSLPSGAYSTQKRQPVDGQGISSIIIGYLISLSPPPPTAAPPLHLLLGFSYDPTTRARGQSRT